MCFSLKASLLALAVNWLSSSYLWYTGDTWTRWLVSFSFWYGFVQAADAGLWYAHEVDGQRFQDCTRSNQWLTAFALANIFSQVAAMFVASYTHRRTSTKRKALEMAVALAWWCFFCALVVWNECRAETEGVYFCSQLSEMRTIEYGYGKDKWGTNKCLRRGVFFGERVSGPSILMIIHMALMQIPSIDGNPHNKNRAVFVVFCQNLIFWPAVYFGSLASTWCFLSSIWPLCVALANWLFPVDKIKKK